jgi:hypothetical protein
MQQILDQHRQWSSYQIRHQGLKKLCSNGSFITLSTSEKRG